MARAHPCDLSQARHVARCRGVGEGRRSRRDRRLDLPGLDIAYTGAGAEIVETDVADHGTGEPDGVVVAGAVGAAHDHFVRHVASVG